MQVMRTSVVLLATLLLFGCTRTPPKADPKKMEVLYGSPVSSSSSSAGNSLSQAAAHSTNAPSPKSLLISVPFSPQAPSANWDALHEESCEEMSLIMVAHFWEKTSLSSVKAEEEIQALVQWEEKHGYPQDVTIGQLAVIAKQRYGMNATVSTDVSVQSIKDALNAGKPVIIPAAGRDLGNPYFSGEGPWYHMLVITGYDGKYFITNDPGTKRGENYEYDQNVLLSAIHDWTGVKEEIRTGRKAMLIPQP